MPRGKKKVPVEAVDAPAETPVEVAPVAPVESDQMAVTLKNGKVVLGKKVLINGKEHVEISENGSTYLVHDLGDGLYGI